MSGRPTSFVKRVLDRLDRVQVSDRGRGEAAERLSEELAQYARRLAPSETTLKRIERRVIAAHRRTALVQQATWEPLGALVSSPESARGPRPGRRCLALTALRGPAVAGALVVLLLVVLAGAATAESAPGHPLYHARLALETLALPGESSAERATAQLQRMRVRLTEAGQAAEHSDAHAVTDALAAYHESLQDVVEVILHHPTTDREMVDSLAGDSRLLASLLTRVPDRARLAVRRALRETQRAKRIVDLSASTSPGAGRSKRW